MRLVGVLCVRDFFGEAGFRREPRIPSATGLPILLGVKAFPLEGKSALHAATPTLGDGYFVDLGWATWAATRGKILCFPRC
jgi:hypothetical protein